MLEETGFYNLFKSFSKILIKPATDKLYEKRPINTETAQRTGKKKRPPPVGRNWHGLIGREGADRAGRPFHSCVLPLKSLAERPGAIDGHKRTTFLGPT